MHLTLSACKLFQSTHEWSWFKCPAKAQRIPRTNLRFSFIHFDNRYVVSLNCDVLSRGTIGLVEERKKKDINSRVDERGEKVTNIRISANAWVRLRKKHKGKKEGRKSIPRLRDDEPARRASRRDKSEMHFRINLSHRCYSYKVSEKL